MAKVSHYNFLSKYISKLLIVGNNIEFLRTISYVLSIQIIAMKKQLLTLATAALLTIGVSAQNDTIPKNSISSQIENKLTPVYDAKGDMIQGQAQVFFTLTDSSTISIQGVISKDKTIKRQIERELEGMEIKTKEEDLGKVMNINISFTQK